MNTTNLADLTARNKIVTELGRNFFVEAGAGSGKTTMLVDRMVSLVESGVPVSEICAITFTKAAAREFYERFENCLSERAKGKAMNYFPDPTPETCRLAKEALKNIDTCFLGTIDAFCEKVIHEHPIEAGIKIDAELKTDAEIEDTLSLAYVKALENGQNDDKLKKYLAASDNPKNDFVNYMPKFLESRGQTLCYGDGPALEKTIDESFADCRAALIALKDPLQRVCNSGLQNADDLKDGITKLLTLTEAVSDPSFQPKNDLNLLENIASQLSDVKFTLKADVFFDFSDKFGIDNLYPCGSAVYKLKSVKNSLKQNPDAVAAIESMLRENKTLIETWAPDNGFKDPDSSLPMKDRLNLIFELSLPPKFSIPEDLRQYYDFKPGRGANFKPFADSVSEKLETLKSAAKSLRFFWLCDFLNEQLEETEKELQSKGVLSFFDCLYYLKEMLRKDIQTNGGRLCEHILKRHSRFLMDEFQDTNPLQSELFFYLTGGNRCEKWQDCRPREGSLFIVGDPKQSIYRFRGADVAAFNEVKSLFPSEQVLSLTENFRSSKQLCEAFNRLFAELFRNPAAYQGVYRDIPTNLNPDIPDSGIFRYTVSDEEDPETVCAIVYNLKQRKNYRYGDFLLIKKSKESLSRYTKVLYEHNIPFRLEGESAFSECPVLVNAYSLLKSKLVFDDCRGPYYAVRNCFSCDRETMIRLRDGDKAKIDWRSLQKTSLQEFTKNVNAYLPLSALLANLIGESIASGVSLQNLEYAYYALELLKSREIAQKIITLKDALTFFEKMFEGDRDFERCLSLTDREDAVHVANLHKIKGLEAKAVILLNSAESKNSPAFYRDFQNGKKYLFSMNSESGFAGPSLGEKEYEAEKEEAEYRMSAEYDRELYVAATRAKEQLYVCLCAGGRGGCFWEKLLDGTEVVSDAETSLLTAEYPETMREQPKESAQDSATVFDRYSGRETYRLRRPSVEDTNGANDEPVIVSDAGTDTGSLPQGEKIRTDIRKDLIGTLVHRTMQLMVESRNRYSAEELSRMVPAEFEIAENKAEEVREIIRKVASSMKNGGFVQENGVSADLIPELLSADAVYCELPFTYCAAEDGDKCLTNGIIDVLYRKNGVWHILDYKTNSGRTDEQGRDWETHYRGQLNSYIQAIKAITGVEAADAHVYHIEIST